MWEAKVLFQPLAVRLLDGAQRAIQLRSKYDFITTAHLAGTWELSIDGVVCERGKLAKLELKPGETCQIQVACGNPQVRPGQEAYLTLRWRDSRNMPLTGKDHEVAWAQFAIPVECSAPALPAVVTPRGKLLVEQGKSAINITGVGVEVALDRSTGRLTTWTVGGVDLLTAGPQPCVWRAPTDNDGIRLWDMKSEPIRNKYNPCENKPVRRWMVAHLDRAQTVVEKVSAKAVAAGAEVLLRTRTWGYDKAKAIVAEHRLHIGTDGTLAWSHRFDVHKDLPDLPRLGVELLLPPDLDRLEWLGLGPHETYNDRRACGMVGRFGSTVQEQYIPHIMPQEHGHHLDTRWLSLRRSDGSGVLISGAPMLEFNASCYDQMDLTKARHTYDIKASGKIHLHLDAAHRGLGTASCGPDAFEQYRILPGKRYQLSYRMIPLKHGDEATAKHRG